MSSGAPRGGSWLRPCHRRALSAGGFCIPLYIPYALTGEWRLGRDLCKLWLVVDYLVCTASVFNIVLISFDRFICVTRAVRAGQGVSAGAAGAPGIPGRGVCLGHLAFNATEPLEQRMRQERSRQLLSVLEIVLGVTSFARKCISFSFLQWKRYSDLETGKGYVCRRNKVYLFPPQLHLD